MYKNIFGGNITNIYVRSRFSRACVRLTTCVRAHKRTAYMEHCRARTPIPHHFSQLLQAHPRSPHYFLHPPFLRPFPPPPPLSASQHHLLLQTARPHHVPEELHPVA